MSPDERAELACALAALEASPGADDASGPGQPWEPGPLSESDLPGNPRSRAFALIAVIGCGLVLAAWIGVLAVTLPRYYRSGGWRGAWVGFDLGLLITFAITAWAAAAPPAGHRLPGRARHPVVLRRLVRRDPGSAHQ